MNMKKIYIILGVIILIVMVLIFFYEIKDKINYTEPMSEEKNIHQTKIITNEENLSNELKKFIEENSGLNCQVLRMEYYNSYESYYDFTVQLNNNENYWIEGEIYDTLENKKNCFIISDFLKQDYNLEKLQFKAILNYIAENRKEDNKIINNQDKTQQTNNFVNNEELKMVEKYLSNKYNMNLEIIGCYYLDNGELGIYAGKHYKFFFKPIEGFELNASLDYLQLNEESLAKINLNITNIDMAKELIQYVEMNSKLKCKVIECRFKENDDNYLFNIVLDNNSNYRINGKFNNTLDNAGELYFSDSLKQNYNLEYFKLKTMLNNIKNN